MPTLISARVHARPRAVLLRWLVVLIATSLFAVLAPPTGTPLAQAAPTRAQTAVEARDFASDLLDSLTRRTGASDPRYFSKNVWQDGSSQCFRCQYGAAVLSAADGVVNHDEAARKRAIASFDQAIRTHQYKDGSYGPAAPGEGGRDLQTVLFGNELAQAYVILGNYLPESKRRVWRASLTRAADFLIRNGNLEWYTNGNIMVATAMFMDLTRKIIKKPRFTRAADKAYTFAVTPPQQRWRGFGLIYVTRPAHANGSDGAAYFAESSGGEPGFDPAYGVFQLNLASSWFYLTGNPRAERLTNLLMNALMPRVRTSDWTIDVSGGSRRGAPGLRYGFYVSAVPVLVAMGSRPELETQIRSQLTYTESNYRSAATYVHPAWSYNFGAELAISLLALNRMG